MTQAIPGYPPQPYAPQPYPPQQPGYPPQFPAPQQFGQFAPGYPPAPAALPPQQLAQGSIDDFYNQPSTGGGKSLSFPAGQFGTRYVGVVARAITSGDIQQQTNTKGVPQTFKDGRPKFEMKVPLQLQPSQTYPDGLAQWYVKGQARDELVRAMAEANAPAGPPEAGAVIDITYVADRAAGAGMNPAKQFHVVYTRPTGETSSPAPAAPQPAAQPVQYAQPPQAPVAQQYAPQPPAQAPAQPAPPAAPVAGPSDLSDAQRELLARLTGGQPQG